MRDLPQKNKKKYYKKQRQKGERKKKKKWVNEKSSNATRTTGFSETSCNSLWVRSTRLYSRHFFFLLLFIYFLFWKCLKNRTQLFTLETHAQLFTIHENACTICIFSSYIFKTLVIWLFKIITVCTCIGVLFSSFCIITYKYVFKHVHNAFGKWYVVSVIYPRCQTSVRWEILSEIWGKKFATHIKTWRWFFIYKKKRNIFIIFPSVYLPFSDDVYCCFHCGFNSRVVLARCFYSMCLWHRGNIKTKSQQPGDVYTMKIIKIKLYFKF